jgi:nicotinamide-nucleotide amidase
MIDAKVVTAEIVTIGDELCRGEIVDTNSTWLAERLTALGLHVRWRTSVTDDVPDMIDALTRACGRAQVVVTSGGLGPTDDDRTVDVICGLLGVDTAVDAAHEERLKTRLEGRKATVNPLVMRQVRTPTDATVLANPTGFAPGFTVRLGGAQLSSMPGVPREMKPMFDAHLAPELAALVGDSTQTAKRVLHVFGLGESNVGVALRGLMDGAVDSTLHYRIAFPEVLVTIVVRRPDRAAADAELSRLVALANERLGANVFGTDGTSMARTVGESLVARKETMAVAESCTGGMLGSILTEVPGSSRWFEGGVIAYANGIKSSLLDVDPTLVARDGAVSESVAIAMALGARARCGTTWALSITGVAGPDGGTPEKPVGTVWLGIAGPRGSRAKRIDWPGERDQVRRIAAFSALDTLRREL